MRDVVLATTGIYGEGEGEGEGKVEIGLWGAAVVGIE
jgi:hypothetical protein